MRHDPQAFAGWERAGTPGLPGPLDCESRALLRLFLAPILESSPSWTQIVAGLAAKGYRLAFREGHLVILDEMAQPICTGSDLGVPMAQISARIGRPCVRAHADGQSGVLDSRT